MKGISKRGRGGRCPPCPHVKGQDTPGLKRGPSSHMDPNNTFKFLSGFRTGLLLTEQKSRKHESRGLSLPTRGVLR